MSKRPDSRSSTLHANERTGIIGAPFGVNVFNGMTGLQQTPVPFGRQAHGAAGYGEAATVANVLKRVLA